MIVLGALQRPCPIVKNSNVAHIEQTVNKESEIIWTSDSSGKTTIIVNKIENKEVTAVNVMSYKQDNKHDNMDSMAMQNEKNVSSDPSYLGLLKRPKVIRSLIIVYCGITGSLGKNKSI